MINTRYILFVVIISSASAALRLSCDPGEESKSHNFICDFSQSNRTQFTWRKDQVTIASCSLFHDCEVEQFYRGTYTSSIGSYTAILTINSVNRTSAGIYSCYGGTYDTASCDFRVYARPESVSCQQPEYQTTTENVKVMCTAKHIYPYPACQFSWFKNGTTMSVTQNIDYQNMFLQGQPGYYNPTCILSLPAVIMGLGSHVFRVRVYPNVTGNDNHDILYGTDSSLTLPVNTSKCQLENSNIENMVYKVRVNGSIEISIPVFGYPEPILHLDSDTILDTKTYSLTYTNLRPSYGVVSLQIYTVTEIVFQSYRLSITNSEGSLVYNFQIKEGVPAPVIHSDGTDPTNIGAIVGGIIAGILIIVAVVLIIVYLKRTGNLTRGVRNKNPDTNMQTISPGKQKDLHYENIRRELPKKCDPLSSPYETINDSSSNSPYEEIRDVPPRPQYENSTDFLSDRPSNNSDHTHVGFSDSHQTKVLYENTVPAL